MKKGMNIVWWHKVKHFGREEWVKDPDKISHNVVYLADRMRDAAGVPIVVHVAWDDGGHAENSSHYADPQTGLAYGFDFHFVGWPVLDQWLFAERFPWCGIGVYPFWRNPGLHCDLHSPDRPGRRWWRDEHGVYRPLDRELLRLLL